MGLLGERIDGVDDHVVSVEREGLGIFCTINILHGADLGIGIDAEQAFPHHLYFHTPHGRHSGGHLAVDIRDAHPIGIDQCEPAHTRSHQTLGAPASHTADTEEDDTQGADALQHPITHQQACAVENVLFAVGESGGGG